MDSNRFDNWTKNRALRLSRRNALRLAGIGGVSTAMAARPLASLAQSPCTLTLHGETAGGPSAPTVYDGVLTVTVGTDGALTQSSFTPKGGAPVPASGSLIGRAVDLSIALSSGQTLVLSGTTDQKGPTCPTAAGGILSGPRPGDLGGWQATSASGSTAPATTSGQTTNPPPSGSNCPAPSFSCGPNCCPSGATCTNATQGICACPGGTTQCGLTCTPNCPNGQTLDLGTCTCGSTCVPDQGSCTSDADCCTGFCGRATGICQTCPFIACEGFGCVDPSIDPQNCGGCGIVCGGTTASCTDGVCTCQPDGNPCIDERDCCTGACSPSGICGCVPVGSACSGSPDCCDFGNSIVCVFDTCRYLDNRHACFADNECLTGICSNGACASCLDPGEGPCTRDAECCNYNGLGCVNGVCPL